MNRISRTIRKSFTLVEIIVAKNLIIPPTIFFEKIVLISAHSFILHAVTSKTPARAESGILAIIGANKNIEIKSPIA